jgi:hypothetical protein
MRKIMVTARGISENLISNAIWAALALAVAGLAAMLASLNPFLKLFAPLSYLMAALIALLLMALIAFVGAAAWRRWRPSPALPALDHHPEGVSQADLDAAFEVLKQRIVVVDATYAGHVAGLTAKIEKLEKPSPGDYLAYERWIQMMEEGVNNIADKAKAACEQIMAQGGLTKGVAISAAQVNANMMLEGDAYSAGDRINEIMEQISGKTFEFSAKPILAENPNRYAEGEEKIENPERQYEYRKAYWTARQIESAMNDVRKEFGHARGLVYNTVIKVGPLFKGLIK